MRSVMQLPAAVLVAVLIGIPGMVVSDEAAAAKIASVTRAKAPPKAASQGITSATETSLRVEVTGTDDDDGAGNDAFEVRFVGGATVFFTTTAQAQVGQTKPVDIPFTDFNQCVQANGCAIEVWDLTPSRPNLLLSRTVLDVGPGTTSAQAASFASITGTSAIVNESSVTITGSVTTYVLGNIPAPNLTSITVTGPGIASFTPTTTAFVANPVCNIEGFLCYVADYSASVQLNPQARQFPKVVVDARVAIATSPSTTQTLATSVPLKFVAPPVVAPSACTLTPEPRQLQASGGQVKLTVKCDGGDAPTEYAWTGPNVVANTTLPTQTVTVSAVPANFTAIASNAGGPSNQAQATVTLAQQPTGTKVTAVSGNGQQGTAGQQLGAPLVVLVTDANNNPVSGASSQLQASSSVPADVISSQGDVPGEPGQYSYLVTLSADTSPRTIKVCLVATPTQCANFAISTSQQTQEQAKTVIGPQAAAAISTPTQQLGNIQQRLDNLRTMRNPTVTQGLNISFDGRSLPPASAFAVAPTDKDGKPAAARGGGAAADKESQWGVFVQGDLDIGKLDSTSSQPGFDIHTKGLTVGTDYRFAGSNNVLGAALGFTKSDTDLANNGGNQDTTGWSLSVYGEYVPVPNAYVNLAMNYGQNRYDSTRRLTDSTGSQAEFNSNPRGNQFAVALSAGYQFYSQAMTLTPYGRVEYVDAQIDAFDEGGGPGAIQFSEQRYKSTVLTVGGQVQYAWSVSWGVLVPYLRAEYQYAAQTSTNAITVQPVAPTPGTDSTTVAAPDIDRSYGNLSAGVTAVVGRGLSGYFNYQYLFAKENFSSSRYTLGIRFDF